MGGDFFGEEVSISLFLAMGSAPELWSCFLMRCLPPCGRAYFLLRGQKKVAKEKATPGSVSRYAGFPALLETPGGCATRGCAPQTVLADCPRHFCVARHLSRGPKGGMAEASREQMTCCGQLPKKGKNQESADTLSAPDGLPGPLRGAKQRRRAGGSRLALFEPQASSGKPPGLSSSARNRACPAPTQGWPFLWLLSFGHTKESTPARKAEPQANHQAKKTKSC